MTRPIHILRAFLLSGSRRTALATFLAIMLAGCSYNPLSSNNHTTGSPVGAISGATVGGVGSAAFGASKPVMGIAALAGGTIGYYTTTLRYDAGGVYQTGGKVYKVGDYVGIYIPTDNLFEPNSADFVPQAEAILDSTVDVLQRYPDNNIMISGNTSGFGHARWEQKLSEKRAEKVAGYLWNAGINQFKNPGTDMRKLTYVGYGDYLPISSNLDNKGLRQNSRIQITSYPSTEDLRLDPRHLAMHNFGESTDCTNCSVAKNPPCKFGSGKCYDSEYNE